ncbi:DNA mismatch repair endonuclease MutL, partial [Candidatus Gracilibacteria bacterium]|nr:DNA mismatch repair endonuclease MutL [Candidatus Gracilibacteria bacterium]
ANQIAAGEVVERPFSVVKELVENSIDAGATSVKVEIKEGGIEEIVVIDDGGGIDKDDLSLVTEKYTTSKITSIEDLYNVMTFGFRGEALASISSVSRFQIVSKTADSDFGYCLEVIDGEESDVMESPCETGTKIIVKNLFYNTPARLNYLKKPRTEYTHIADFLKQMSLSYPEVAFELVSDEKTVFTYRQGEDLQTRIYSVYGEDFFENTLELNVEMSGIKLSGFISDPKVSFGSNKKQSLFVNKRIIKSPLIFKAISNAYNRFIPHSQHSGYVLNIDVNPTEVDVNVHPRKLEVRFANESSIFRGIYHAIQSRLEGVSLMNLGDSEESNNTEDVNRFSSSQNNFQQVAGGKNPEYYTGSGTKFKSYSPYKNTSANPGQGKIGEAMNFSESIINGATPFSGEREGLGMSSENSGNLNDTPLGRIIGQMHNSYILVQTEEGLKILDQHALAERIIYEKLVNNQYSEATQGLLIGESITLSASELDIIDKHTAIFEEMGFEWEKLSNGIVMINAIPDFIKKDRIASIFTGVIQDIGELGNKKSLTLEEVRNKIFAYASCRSAIKFGHKLSLFEMNKLLHDSVIDYSATCPHGRPVVFDIGLQELQDKYER